LVISIIMKLMKREIRSPIRFKFSLDKLATCIAMLAQAELNEFTKLKIIKLLYFIDKDHLLKYGKPVLGDIYYHWDHDGIINANNPYRSEILQGKDKTFEVLYYYTDIKNYDAWYGMKGIADDELTPLVFDEGKLIGWGWSYLEANVKKYEIRMR